MEVAAGMKRTSFESQDELRGDEKPCAIAKPLAEKLPFMTLDGFAKSKMLRHRSELKSKTVFDKLSDAEH